MGRGLSLIAIAGLGSVLAFQNCARVGQPQSAGLPSFSSVAVSSSGQMNVQSTLVASSGNWPEGFGAALQAPGYNPNGPIASVLRDGADDALRMGIKTFKINMSRGILNSNNANFYRIADPALGRVNSLVDLARVADFSYVLSRPFKTIFIDADNISLDGRTNNYWNFESMPMQDVDRQAIFRETYDFAKHLLTRFASEDRIFVLQNHEGDSHTTPDAHPHGVPTDVGLRNFREYWQIRQSAIERARADVASRAKVFHMCEIVKVAEYLRNPGDPQKGKSLLRDVLPQVTCDLIGYSAHDTAINGDGGVMLYAAIAKIKQLARVSPTFGTNHVILSEVAVPEVPTAYGNYRSLTPQVAGWISTLLQQGMPYVLYWQLYDNDGIGNYLRRANGSMSYMHEQLSMQFHGKAFPRTEQLLRAPAIPVAQPVLKPCTDELLINPPIQLFAGVTPEIKRMYDDVLGGIGGYLEGARYLSQLQAQGYTVSSLRADLIKESAVETHVNVLYRHYLRRAISAADLANVRAFLLSGGTLRQLELQIVSSPECRR